MQSTLTPLDLKSIARGAASELFESSLAKVLDNIADPSTEATARREITLKFRFTPGKDRRSIEVTTTAACKLAGVTEHSSQIYLGKDPEGKCYAFADDPRQEQLFAPPPQVTSLIEFSSK